MPERDMWSPLRFGNNGASGWGLPWRRSHRRRIATVLFQIEAITHQELVVDDTTHVLNGSLGDSLGGLVEQRDDFYRRRARRLDPIIEETQGPAAIDDFLNN